MKQVQYWVVGAMFGGVEDVLDGFIKRGYWYCWDKKVPNGASSQGPHSVKQQIERFKQMKAGDRIAVKKIHSVQNQQMEVRALGIITDIDEEEWRVYVDWKVRFEHLERIVSLHGCSASIHGPFLYDNNDIRDIFCL